MLDTHYAKPVHLIQRGADIRVCHDTDGRQTGMSAPRSKPNAVPMEFAQLACPLCDGIFQVDVAWQGTQVACPHCEQVVSIPLLHEEPPIEAPQIAIEPEAIDGPSTDAPPAAPSEAPPVPSAPTISKVEAILLARRMPSDDAKDTPFAVRDVAPKIITTGGRTVELRRRTPDEQRRFRRRLHLTVAIAGAAVLVLLMFALLQFG